MQYYAVNFWGGGEEECTNLQNCINKMCKKHMNTCTLTNYEFSAE